MMKLNVDYMSDVHINHHVPFRNNQEKWKKQTVEWTNKLLQDATGEVLIVAGDFSEWNVQTQWFLEECSKHYDHVFITAGNHDYYLLSNNQREKYKDHKRRRQQSRVRLEEMFHNASQLPNVTVLHGDVVSYKGFIFGGHSLWYKPETYADFSWFESNSNDRRYISVGQRYPKESYDVLYGEALAWYNTIEKQPFDVFISHIPPVNPPNGRDRNACYIAPLPFLANTKYWVCGHQHVQSSFEKHDIQFHMNPIGYPNEKPVQKVRTFTITK